MDNVPVDWRSELQKWEKTNSKTMSAELKQLRDYFVREFPIDESGTSYARESNVTKSFLSQLQTLTSKLPCFQLGTNNDPDSKYHLLAEIHILNNNVIQNEFEKAGEYCYPSKHPFGDRHKDLVKREAFVGKIFYWHYPDKFMPVFIRLDCVDFSQYFRQPEKNRSLLSINHDLLTYLKSQPEFFDYDSCQIAKFLYDRILKVQQEQRNNKSKSKPNKPRTTTSEDFWRIKMQNKIVQKLQRLSVHTRNIILYGPPGTGKTHAATNFAEAFLSVQLKSPLSVEEIKNNVFKSLNWYEMIAVVLYINRASKPKMKASEIQKESLMEDYWRTTKTAKLGNMIQAMLQSHTDPSVEIVRYSNRQKPFIFEKNIESQWFLTDEGIEYITLNLEEQIQSLTYPRSSEPNLREYIDSVTFHQSFFYEEFMEGIKPRTDDDGNITYPVVDGIFKEFCKKAEADPDRKYLFIIDEINRANIAKVFGELITIIEDDKRGTEVKLPYSQELFSVPKNLYIIGTMNTADRSIALLDIALRRRFAFVEVLPDPDLLQTVDGIDLPRLLKTLNQKITNTLGRDYQIGHSYFLGLANLEALEFAWYYRVIPLLQEYYYSDGENLKSILGDFIIFENNDSEGSRYRSISAYSIKELTGEDFRRAIEKLYRSPTI